MKILISTDTVGGVLTYTAELAAALEAQGDEVAVAAMGPRMRHEQRALLPRRVHESGFRLEWMEDPWDEVAAAAKWLLALEEEERPDVVHLCSFAHGAAPFQAPKVVVAHSCVLSWWRAVHGGEAPPEWDRYRDEMERGLRGADAVVAPTWAMLAELERDRDLRSVETAVIHNGASAPLAPDAPEKQPLVLAAGRFWDPAKNLATLDAAAAKLSWPVAVAGELGRDGGSEHVESLGVLGRDELTERRRAASIYAAPAVYEPFGLGVLEAAQDRCALVLGDIPSLRELWDGAAVFVEPRDERALSWALESLIEDEEQRAELAVRAHRRAATYSIGRTARTYRSLYERLRETSRTEVAS